MPSVLKRVDQYMGPWSDSRSPTLLVIIGVTTFAAVLGVVAVSTAHIMKWWEATIIAATIIVLAGALAWSCYELRRIHK
jgi:hypothetical protein